MFGFDRSRRQARPLRTGRNGSTDRAPVLPSSVGRRVAVLGVFAAMVLALGSLAVSPARAWWDQQARIAEAETRLASLDEAVKANAARLAALDTDAELERLARRDFSLAKPGEEIYVVLPPPADLPQVPQGWPFDQVALRLAPR
jgi:cell division protein FtsB